MPDTQRPMAVTLQVVSIVLFTFIGYLNIGIPLAVLPGYVHSTLGYGAVIAGLVISVQYLATLLSRPYAGKIIEYGPIKSVFAKPQHPYTMGLLGSLPRIDSNSDQELQFIEGAPPDMVRLPKGCSFAPRCKFRSERCLVEEPQLVGVGDDHMAACIRLPEIHAQ